MPGTEQAVGRVDPGGWRGGWDLSHKVFRSWLRTLKFPLIVLRRHSEKHFKVESRHDQVYILQILS